jgi:hypothetical protein
MLPRLSLLTFTKQNRFRPPQIGRTTRILYGDITPNTPRSIKHMDFNTLIVHQNSIALQMRIRRLPSAGLCRSLKELELPFSFRSWTFILVLLQAETFILIIVYTFLRYTLIHVTI